MTTRANAVTVVAPAKDAARIARLGKAAVWIHVALAPSLDEAPGEQPIVVIGDPARPPGDPRVAFVARAAMPDDQLQAVLAAVATGSALAPLHPPGAPRTAAEAERARLAFTATRRLAAAVDLAATEAIARTAVAELLEADRAHCLYYDAASGALWSEERQRGNGDERRAITGLAGWCARTGLPAAVPAAGDDPRHVAAIDDPFGDLRAQLLVQPILGADARVHAVLVVARAARRPAFGPDDAALLARFAQLAAPLLDQLSIHIEGQQLIEARGPELFSADAVAAAAPQAWGDVVRVAPPWLASGYWLLVGLMAASVALAWLGRVSTYSAGPAVVRSTARSSVTVRSAGNVSAVEVASGQRVTAGTVIARLDDLEPRQDVARLAHAFDAQLRNHMLDPGDALADGQLRTLRLELEQAKNALDERAIRAPADGRVSDLRVRVGQHVEPGDIAASIARGQGGLEVVALLPGQDRPQLAPGMTLRLELAGYRYAYQQVVIDSVSPDVIAPAEAKRVLGSDVDVRLGGPVVLVHGVLAGPTFEADGERFDYHDGMIGTAEVRVRTERILEALVPGLRSL